jgi:hypothetical protein
VEAKFPSVIFEKISLEMKKGKTNAVRLIIKIINPLKLCKNPANATPITMKENTMPAEFLAGTICPNSGVAVSFISDISSNFIDFVILPLLT